MQKSKIKKLLCSYLQVSLEKNDSSTEFIILFMTNIFVVRIFLIACLTNTFVVRSERVNQFEKYFRKKLDFIDIKILPRFTKPSVATTMYKDSTKVCLIILHFIFINGGWTRDFEKGGECSISDGAIFQISKAKIMSETTSFWQNVSVNVLKFSLFL